jgi:hypothetical protein
MMKMIPNLSSPAAIVVSVGMATLVSSCSSPVVTQYDAIAEVTYTWQVEYAQDSDRPNDVRQETFASTSLINQNGEPPAGAVTGPDDRGLWWPALPPRPTVDEIEARQESSQEQVGTPELVKTVDYRLTFQQDGAMKTLPTDYDVYRQVVKAHERDVPVTLTILDGVRVEKAEPAN